MILPNRLQSGDTIGIIAPAGPLGKNEVDNAIHFFERMNVHVRLGEHIFDKNGYLAGTDADRLADFHTMLADVSIKAIIAARGGYGTARIAEKIDYNLIRKNPKIIWGYSDITYLHTAIRKMTGLITFHGPMAASDIGKANFDPVSKSMFRQLFHPRKIMYTEKIAPLHLIASGWACGQLVGGNLSLLVQTIGTPFEIETAGKLLFIEDIGEEPYKVDAMLNQLRLAGKFTAVKGIVIGDFAQSDSKLASSLTLEQIFTHYFQPLSIPVLAGFQMGHCLPNIAIPLGTEAVLSTAERTLMISPGVL